MSRSIRSRVRHQNRRRPAAVVAEALESRRLLTTVVVNTTVDALFPPATGLSSLRSAILTANASTTPTTITFSPTVFATPQTILLNGNQLEFSGNTTTTIIGPAVGVTVSGNDNSRVFLIDAGVSATISSLVITHGDSGVGGGIVNNGNLALSNVTISGNAAGLDAGMETNGNARLTNVTIFGNSSTDDCGGIGIDGGTASLTNVTVSGNSAANGGGGPSGGGIACHATATLVNVTVSGNSAVGGAGGGIVNYNGPLTLENCIVAGNTISNGGTGPDVSGNFNSLGFNLVGQTDGSAGFNTADLTGTIAHPLNAKLGPLANNGSPTETLLPLAGSPAIDHGLNVYVPKGVTTDQRGLPRIVNGTVDIGAVEVQSAPTITLTGPASQSATLGVPATAQLGTFTQTGASGPFKVDVNWGDGSADTILTLSAAGTIPSTAHTFAKAGSFTVSEVVTDAKSLPSNKATFKETVAAPTTGTVSGQVFGDLNGNAKLDGKEVGLAGWLVYVDANGNGQFDPTEQYALTDSKGNYTLTLKPGTYSIGVEVRGGYYETAPHAIFYKVVVVAGKTVTGDIFGVKVIAPV